MIKNLLFVTCFMIHSSMNIHAQSIGELVNRVKEKIETVKDYKASGKMRTNVTFLKIPLANIIVYYKNPRKFKMVSEKGLSFIPKGSLNINLNTIFSDGNITIIDGGSEIIDNKKVRIAKILPNEDNSDMVLTTLYIDPSTLLILKSKITSKERGTYELRMNYDKYKPFGLPDQIVFSFNEKDYKLPKGITFDFDDGSSKTTKIKKTNYNKGEVVISFSKYEINKGIPDGLFH